jgi:hypothetical protein
MFATQLTVAGTSVSQVYDLISINGGNSERRDATAALDAPERLIIKHEPVSKGTLKSDRHLVRFEATLPQAVTALPVTGSVHIVIDAPRDTVSAAKILDLVDQVRNFLTAGNLTKLLNNEP